MKSFKVGPLQIIRHKDVVNLVAERKLAKRELLQERVRIAQALNVSENAIPCKASELMRAALTGMFD